VPLLPIVGALVLLAAPTPSPGAVDVVPVLTSTPFGAAAGKPVTHTVTLSAAGTGTITAVRVTFRTTVGLDGVTASANPGRCPTVTSTNVVCELGSVGLTVTITGTVSRGIAPGTLVQNLVEVTSVPPDANTGNNSVSNAYLISGASASTRASRSAAAAPAPAGDGWAVPGLALAGLAMAGLLLLWYWRRRRLLRAEP
jgi:hypothetical protein